MLIVSRLLLAAIGLPGTFAGHADTYSLRWTPKPGDKMSYTTEATLDINGMPGTLKTKSTEQVLKVDPDGTYSVQSSLDEGSVIFNGQQFPMQKSLKVTLYHPNGEIVSITGDQVEASSYRSANLAMLKRPDSPVAISDTWTEDLKADAKSGTVAVHGSYKLDSIEKVGDVDTLKIIAMTKETEGEETGAIDAVYWISKADGSLVKYLAKWTNVTFAGAPAPLNGTLTMTRIAQ